jgi:hypothetical protein
MASHDSSRARPRIKNGIAQRDQTEEGREQRRHRDFELEVEVTVRTDSGLFPGRTHDISESGMSAILPAELREGQEVELQIRLPGSTETIRAIVRHRNVFRHGFEFVQPLHAILWNEAVTR